MAVGVHTEAEVLVLPEPTLPFRKQWINPAWGKKNSGHSLGQTGWLPIPEDSFSAIALIGFSFALPLPLCYLWHLFALLISGPQKFTGLQVQCSHCSWLTCKPQLGGTKARTRVQSPVPCLVLFPCVPQLPSAGFLPTFSSTTGFSLFLKAGQSPV